MAEQSAETVVQNRIVKARRTQTTSLRLNDLGPTELPESNGQLNQNQLLEVPVVVGWLTQLRTLDLKRNKLKSLPEWLSKLTQLRRLYLIGKEALGLPPEILGPEWSEDGGAYKKESTKPANILQYYFKRSEEGTRCLNEAKIILVGQDDLGKTSLVRRLTSDKHNPKEQRTEGVNIVQWRIPGKHKPTEEEIRLHVWDFGGQEIMHATRQFFFTKRSLYLLVLDASKDENESSLHYWLKMIQSYAEDAPVLVVINKGELSDHGG